MAVTTRNGRKTTIQETSQRTTGTTEATPSARQASRPTPYYLLIYIVLLATGSLYSTLHPAQTPSLKPAPLVAGITSDANTAAAPASVSYFAGKHNFINVYFVKMGWFWTTLAFTLLQLTTKPPPKKSSQHYIQSFTRYAILTVAWFLTTQWMFGPALIDRSFTITGGHCEARPASLRPAGTKISVPDDLELAGLPSSYACRAAGGRWRGGHDMSGHIFMLVLSSAFLLFELYISDLHSSHPSITPQAANHIAHDLSEDEKKQIGGWESGTLAKVRVYSRYLVWTVIGLDLWMILMTAIWFHTWPEKLSGLMLSVSTIWTTYFLPDFVPALREIVGGV